MMNLDDEMMSLKEGYMILLAPFQSITHLEILQWSMIL